MDIEGDLGPTPRFETKVKMRYDDTCLWVAAYMEEPQVSPTREMILPTHPPIS